MSTAIDEFVEPGTHPLTQKEFALFQALILREAGIFLSEAKKALLAGRLGRRLRELGLRSYGEYYRCVLERGEAERTLMLDCICTNETQFFRESRQFEFLEQRVLPQWSREVVSGARPRRIRAWSAGCSTGEEPFSLAMTLVAHAPPPPGWQIEILATDLSTRALEKARVAVWPIEKSEQIPVHYLKAFMLKGTGRQEGKMKAGPEIRSVVDFQRLNLNDDVYPVSGLFDLILCRNVLIYFDPLSRARVIARLLRHLAPTGYFLIGHAESLNAVTDQARSVIPAVYVHAQGAPHPSPTPSPAPVSPRRP